MYVRGIVTILMLACVILQGCANLRSGGAPEPSFDINSDLEKLALEFESGTNITNFYKAPSKDARNRFVTGRLVQIDLRYLQFIRALTADKQQLDSATDIANLTLNLAGTLVGGARAKTNLAALAAGISGSKAIIDKDYYYEKSIDALVATMNAKRKEVLVGMLKGLTLPLDFYSFETAVIDLNEYYLAGTLNGALRFIHSEAVKSETISDKDIKEVRYKLTSPTLAQIDDLKRLTDDLGDKKWTLEKANNALRALGVNEADLPTILDDKDGKPGAKRKLKQMISEAKNLADSDARTAALKKISDVFDQALK